MKFYVYRKGVGPIFGSKPKERVSEFDSWDEAHNFVVAQNEHWFGTYTYWMTDH